MKRRILLVLCTIFIITFSNVVLASAELKMEDNLLVSEKRSYESIETNTFNSGPVDDLIYAKQRSYYFYDMIPDYFEVQEWMKSIYGHDAMENTYQHYFLKQFEENFEKYYETDDISYLEEAIDYLDMHHTSIGNYHISTYDTIYKLTSDEKRAYVPSSFNKDRADITNFSLFLMKLIYPF